MGSMNVRFEERRDNKDIIWVTGCPKSGTTWLARLLGQATNSPIGGPYDTAISKYRNPPASEENGRNGPFWIFQEHIASRPDTSRIKFVHVVRDPRDVAVSAFYYWKQESLEKALERLTTAGWPYCYSWHNVNTEWIKNGAADHWVRYEDILVNPAMETYKGYDRIGLGEYVTMGDCKIAADLHEINKRRQYAMEHGDKLNLGKEHQLRMLRKGIAGDWKNLFTRELAKEANDRFWPWLEYLDYEQDPNWWKQV